MVPPITQWYLSSPPGELDNADALSLIANTKTFNVMYYDIVNSLLHAIFYLVNNDFDNETVWQEKWAFTLFCGLCCSDICNRLCYCWCFVVIAVYLVGVFVVSVIVLPRSVLRHFVPPCIAVSSMGALHKRLNFKSEELFVPNGHITPHYGMVNNSIHWFAWYVIIQSFFKCTVAPVVYLAPWIGSTRGPFY